MKNTVVTVTVNGKTVTHTVSSDESALDFLRNRLQLTGVKHGCSSGSCGACTIVVNQKAVKACCLPAWELNQKDVLTVEGLSRDGALHPLQSAFLESGAVQCGYCTPGMLMASYALLCQNPHPDRPEIRKALKGNLCRCTGYIPIEEAVLSASKSLPSSSTMSAATGVGSSPWRTDGIDKVTGKTRFTADMSVRDQLIAAPVWTPIPCGTLKKIHIEKALRLPGVDRILTWKDIPGMNAIGRWRPDRPVLVKDKVRYWGDILALVVAESESAARCAADVVEVEVDSEPGLYTIREALDPNAIPLHDGGNIAASMTITKAPEIPVNHDGLTLEDHFETGFVEHALLETEAALAFIDQSGVLTVIGPSQNVFFDRYEIQRILGIPARRADQIRVVQAPTGAAFGKREDMAAQPLAALACWITRRPVKVVFSRQDSFRATTKRHPMQITTRTTLSKNGTLSHRDIKIDADTGAYTSWAPNILRKALVHAPGPYGIPSLCVTGRSIHTNSAFSGAMRGFGATQTILAGEYHMDHLAIQAGEDPLEFRLKNALTEQKSTATGQKLPTAYSLPSVLTAAADTFNWTGSARGKHRSGPVSTGYGIAGAFYGIGYGNAIPDKGQVLIRIDPDGEVNLSTGAIDYGQGSSTIFLQIVSEILGVSWKYLTITSGDTRSTPDSGSTVASRQTFVTGNAVLKGCHALRNRLIPVAAELAETSPDLIHVDHNGWMTPRGSAIPWMELIQHAARRNIVLTQKSRHINVTEKLDLTTGQGSVYRTYAFAAACAEVSVNLETGTIQVIRVVSAHDSGRIINPVLARSQVTGGVVMAAGFVLSESYLVNNGVPETQDFDTYRLMRSGDISTIEVVFVETHDPFGPLGAKGLGEPATLAAAPAILNAVTDATGCRYSRVPVTPRKIITDQNTRTHLSR
jgi:CO/xanthine dehydrogenase Mo-binding subunit/aerobic-type carbon monoxide dehydrogenase small subunit (CoxS/CutS family)